MSFALKETTFIHVHSTELETSTYVTQCLNLLQFSPSRICLSNTMLTSVGRSQSCWHYCAKIIRRQISTICFIQA